MAPRGGVQWQGSSAGGTGSGTGLAGPLSPQAQLRTNENVSGGSSVYIYWVFFFGCTTQHVGS